MANVSMRRTGRFIYHPKDPQDCTGQQRKEHQQPVKLNWDPECKARQAADESQGKRDIYAVRFVARDADDRTTNSGANVEEPDNISSSLRRDPNRKREIGQREQQCDVA